MKISCIALEKKMTVQELIFHSILRTYSTFYLQGKIPLTMSEIYKQTDEMYHRILFLPLRPCIEYISQIINSKINRCNQKYYVDAIADKDVIFNPKKFTKHGDFSQETRIEEFYKMKNVLNN